MATAAGTKPGRNWGLHPGLPGGAGAQALAVRLPCSPGRVSRALHRKWSRGFGSSAHCATQPVAGFMHLWVHRFLLPVSTSQPGAQHSILFWAAGTPASGHHPASQRAPAGTWAELGLGLAAPRGHRPLPRLPALSGLGVGCRVVLTPAVFLQMQGPTCRCRAGSSLPTDGHGKWLPGCGRPQGSQHTVPRAEHGAHFVPGMACVTGWAHSSCPHTSQHAARGPGTSLCP